jgi:hypothetical protein
MTSKDARDAVIDAALSGRDRLESAIAISVHFDEVWKELVTRFADRVEKAVRFDLNASEWDVENNGFCEPGWDGMNLRKKSWNGRFFLFIQAGGTSPTYMVAGVGVDVRGEEKDIKGLSEALSGLGLRGVAPQKCMWKGNLPAPYDNLRHPSAMVAMYQNDAVEYMRDLILHLRKIAEPLIDGYIAQTKLKRRA